MLISKPQPPQSYQPVLPPSASSGSVAPVTQKSAHPDLITRYNLASEVASPSVDKGLEGTSGASGLTSNPPKQAWSQNKTERHALLQKRRDEMILAARRKMEEKDQVNGASR